MKKILFISLCTTVLAACQVQNNVVQHENTILQTVAQSKIVRLSDGAQIDANTLLKELAATPMLIVGEEHDNLNHHQIEEWLVHELPKQRASGSYVLEMATPSQQDDIDTAQREIAAGKTLRGRELALHLDWSNGWPWEMYGNLVKALISQSSPVLAGNLDQAEMRSVYRSKSLPTGVLTNQPEVAQVMSGYIQSSHGDTSALQSMLAVQMHRDRRMAETLLKAPRPSILFAGNIHALKDIGVALHIREIAPQEQTNVKVLLLSNSAVQPDSSHADYLWITK